MEVGAGGLVLPQPLVSRTAAGVTGWGVVAAVTAGGGPGGVALPLPALPALVTPVLAVSSPVTELGHPQAAAGVVAPPAGGGAADGLACTPGLVTPILAVLVPVTPELQSSEQISVIDSNI